MNGPGDIPITNGTASERPCGITSFIPAISMSCKGRAEAFARRLQSKLRTLGSQGNDSPTGEDEPIIGLTENSWIARDIPPVTNRQPMRNMSHDSSDAFFDFDCELESPGSPADECEYSRLIETASTTPHSCAPESGYVCASPLSPRSRESSSSDGPYFDPESSEADQRSLPTDYFDCEEPKQDINTLLNGHHDNSETYFQNESSESLSDSLPPSQESTSANTPSYTQTSTFTGVTSASNSTLQDIVLNELQQQSKEISNLQNGHVSEQEEKCETEPSAEENKSETLIQNDVEEIHLTNGHTHVEEKEIDENEISENRNILLVENATETSNEKANNEDENKERWDTNAKEVTSDNDLVCSRKHLSTYDADEDEDKPQRVRRCSSLKTGKTPPGTPGRKKIVRFADVLGLDLADVKTFLDEIPTVPKSAYEDLEILESEPPIQLGPRVEKILMPLFQQPGGLPTFLDMVRDKQVCLENAAVTDNINLTITGCVRVRNLDFHKSVHIRYTLDNWRSYADLQANYVENSCDGFSDKFSFILFGNSMTVGQRMEFAVRFQCKGQQFWDNNYGSNYCFQCLPSTNSSHMRPVVSSDPHILSPIDTWCGSFY